MEAIQDPDLSQCTAIEEMDTGDGLRITFYETEDGGSLLNLEWEEDSMWSYLDEGDFVAAFQRMLKELLGEEEVARAMEGKVIIPIEEMEEMQQCCDALE